MIVSGEASGDLHGARLVEAIKRRLPDVYVCGMGGVELRRQGVDILYDAAKMAVVGIIEVIAHLKDIRKAQNILFNNLLNNRPQLLILIDYPDFNLMLAKKAKKLGIPVFYYISPQVWAWRS
ncbi:MAG: lipid-A-disaccharide synthase, partial [Desulforhopalus sp.]|nr:lipid-A-disaccharide synthase [Desulforhopalus sp.]